MSTMPLGFASADPKTQTTKVTITDSKNASVFDGTLQGGVYQNVPTSNFKAPFSLTSSVTSGTAQLGAANGLVVITYGPDGTGGSVVGLNLH